MYVNAHPRVQEQCHSCSLLCPQVVPIYDPIALACTSKSNTVLKVTGRTIIAFSVFTTTSSICLIYHCRLNAFNKCPFILTLSCFVVQLEYIGSGSGPQFLVTCHAMGSPRSIPDNTHLYHKNKNKNKIVLTKDTASYYYYVWNKNPTYNYFLTTLDNDA